MLSTYDDAALQVIQTKADQLKDTSQIDLNTQINLWRDTVHVRRQHIRDKPTSEIMKEFPGYSNPILVTRYFSQVVFFSIEDRFLLQIFEEIKMTHNIDLSFVIRQQIPILLDKMIEAPAFITDSPAIRLIKVFCRYFDETIHHTFSNTEPSTPYPTLIAINDQIHIYVDFIPIVSTTSPDDALGLLIAMYNIFELNFNKNSRAIRFLYSILHGDKRFLSNGMRLLIKDKGIDIFNKTSQQHATSSNSDGNNSTTTSSSPPNSSNNNSNTESIPVVENKSNFVSPMNTSSSDADVDSTSNGSVTTKQSKKDIPETSTFFNDSHNQKTNSHKRTQRRDIVTQENHKRSIIDDDQDEECKENIVLSNNTNSNVIQKQNKRKRRC
ncbi:unnamed protein product [Rotaria sp. Silwood2]|nr:unnamed protein product [Rotaria sp. Silwood2]